MKTVRELALKKWYEYEENTGIDNYKDVFRDAFAMGYYQARSEINDKIQHIEEATDE